MLGLNGAFFRVSPIFFKVIPVQKLNFFRLYPPSFPPSHPPSLTISSHIYPKFVTNVQFFKQ